MGINGEILANYNHTKWIVLSSMSFIVASLYAYFKQSYDYSALSACISICSINHWRDARYGLRRNIDLTVAYSSGVIYTISGLMSTNVYLSYISLPIIGIIYSTYRFGNHIHMKYPDKAYWVKYHMLFHLLGGCSQILVIKYS